MLDRDDRSTVNEVNATTISENAREVVQESDRQLRWNGPIFDSRSKNLWLISRELKEIIERWHGPNIV